MAGVAEQDSGIGRSAFVALAFVTLLCVGLIGAVGFLKFQIDQSDYALATAYAGPVVTAADASPEQIKKETEAAKARLSVSNDVRRWSLALTLAAWVSLILAAALIIALYLVLQRRQSPALRALAQSISNLSRGDMQTPIWGIERRDAVGDLARAVEQARFHFSQMPDLTVLGDQGPLRLKFEGGARNLFEALIQQLTAQATRVGDEAADLARAASSQHKVLTELPLRLNGALEQLQRFDRANNQSLQRTTQSLAHASTQLEQLVPFMQSRAQNMAEVTQMAGSQVVTTLRNLVETEHSLRANTEQSAAAVAALSSSTQELGERIFAALNLLQASGKVLNETTESTQGRLKELVETLGSGEAKLSEVVERVEKRLEATAQAEESLATLTERTGVSTDRMDSLIGQLAERHDTLSTQIGEATQRLDGVIASFDGAQQALSSALEKISSDGAQLNSVFTELKANNEQVLAKLTRTSETGHEVVQHLSDCSQKLIQQLQERLTAQGAAAQEQIDALARKNEALAARADKATSALDASAQALEQTQDQLATIHGRFTDMITGWGVTIENQAAESFGKAEDFAQQSLGKLSDLTQTVDQALQRLAVLSQLTSTLGTVAGQLGQLVPTLTEHGSVSAPQAAPVIDVSVLADKIVGELDGHWRDLKDQLMAATAQLPVPVDADAAPAVDEKALQALSDTILTVFEKRWRTSVEQIDSVRDDLSLVMERQKDQLEMRLFLLDKQLKSLPLGADSDPRQVPLLQDIVEMLGAMNDQLMRLEMLEVAGHREAASPLN